jgi:hypothetical protein
MPDRPDVRFEDCTLVGPQCSLKASNYGFKTFTWASLNRCRLVTLNFSQPAGTPTDGIIQSVQQGKFLHVDLEDCTLMGYKVFGVKVATNTQRRNPIHDQRRRERLYPVPAGNAQGAFCAWIIGRPRPSPRWRRRQPSRAIPGLVREDKVAVRDACEVTPIVWKGRPCLFVCVRPAAGGSREGLLSDAP